MRKRGGDGVVTSRPLSELHGPASKITGCGRCGALKMLGAQGEAVSQAEQLQLKATSASAVGKMKLDELATLCRHLNLDDKGPRRRLIERIKDKLNL